ncbi:MAG: PPC domain-containing protein, partial [Planctomycetales bacterium]
VEKKGELASRLIHAPSDGVQEQRLSQGSQPPPLRFLPVASKGNRLRFAVLFNRADRYQLHLLANTSSSYSLTSTDPTKPVAPGANVAGRLPVGGSAFYSFQADAGEVFQASLGSDDFDPYLRLYDARGNQVAENDDGGGSLQGRITQMFTEQGVYRLQVSSLGNGGGGDFQLALDQQQPRELALGGRGQGTLHHKGMDLWSFAGEEGKTVFISVRSSECDPQVSLRGPGGARLASDDNHGVGADCLLAVRLPETGRHVIWISSNRGAGAYSVRLIDGD